MINIDKLMSSKRVEVVYADVNVDKEFVKRFRIKNGLTQAALANVLGVKKKTIEKWEQGVHNVGGSSAVLLKLLNDDPELIKRLYTVKMTDAPLTSENKAKASEKAGEPTAVLTSPKLPISAAQANGD